MFFSGKDPVKRMKRQVTKWENVFINHVSDPKLVYRIQKEFSNFNSKKNNYC